MNLAELEKLDLAQTPVISMESLKALGKISGTYDRLTILGTGEISKAFTIKANKVSASAQEKITKAGGKIEIIPIVRHSRAIAAERKAAAASA